MPQQQSFFPVGGGLDLITPDIAKAPGRVIAAKNYEPVSNGYRRLVGYERFDGQTAPSETRLWRINYTLGSANSQPVAGNFILDSTASPSSSHRVGKIVDVIVTSGTWAGGDAVGYIVATNMTHDFTGSTVYFSTAPSPLKSCACSTQVADYDFGASQAAYMATAVGYNRTAITTPTGSGPIRGVWYTASGEIIAARDNVGATETFFYKATTASWTPITFLTIIPFTCDTATQTLPTQTLVKIAAGVANASSSSSDGTIRQVVITDTTGTVNTGYFAVSGYVASQFTAGGQTIYLAGAATVLGTTTAAASVPTSIPAGGRYFFVNHNFYGQLDLSATYMVNGVGKALIYDGNGFTEITTGMTTDTPKRIAVNRDSLFLSFPGGSLQYSSPGEPAVFDPILGAGEIGVGDEITGLVNISSALAILAENGVYALYGYDSTDFQLETLTKDSGALPFTTQRVGDLIYMNNIGITKLSTTAAFGNFDLAAMSKLVSPLLEDLHHAEDEPIASFVVRHRNQYWVLFESGFGLVMYVGAKEPSIMPITLGFVPNCACSVEVDGDERILVGGADGYVYEMDKGTSFDGAVIDHYLRFAHNHMGGPQIDKRVHEIVVDLEIGADSPTLSCEVGIDKGSALSIPSQTLTVDAGAALDSGYFAQPRADARAYIDGIGRTFSLKLSGSTSDEEAHVLTGVTFYISPQQLAR